MTVHQYQLPGRLGPITPDVVIGNLGALVTTLGNHPLAGFCAEWLRYAQSNKAQEAYDAAMNNEPLVFRCVAYVSLGDEHVDKL
jgi:hypothetical protein